MDIATALAFNRIASFMVTVICSWDRSSPIMLEPPETRKTIGVEVLALTDVR